MLDAAHLDPAGLGRVRVVVEELREVRIFRAGAAEILPGAPDDGAPLLFRLLREGGRKVRERDPVLRQKRPDPAREPCPEIARALGPDLAAKAKSPRTAPAMAAPSTRAFAAWNAVEGRAIGSAVDEGGGRRLRRRAKARPSTTRVAKPARLERMAPLTPENGTATSATASATAQAARLGAAIATGCPRLNRMGCSIW
jgi:hypothetical protein